MYNTKTYALFSLPLSRLHSFVSCTSLWVIEKAGRATISYWNVFSRQGAACLSCKNNGWELFKAPPRALPAPSGNFWRSPLSFEYQVFLLGQKEGFQREPLGNFMHHFWQRKPNWVELVLPFQNSKIGQEFGVPSKHLRLFLKGANWVSR